MTRHFEQEMAALKQKLLTMASHAETALANAIKALVDRTDDLARKVITDDSILDHFEIEIDEMSIGLLALQGPLASDLRLITIAMKISHDLERVGDECQRGSAQGESGFGMRSWHRPKLNRDQGPMA